MAFHMYVEYNNGNQITLKVNSDVKVNKIYKAVSNMFQTDLDSIQITHMGEILARDKKLKDYLLYDGAVVCARIQNLKITDRIGSKRARS